MTGTGVDSRIRASVFRHGDCRDAVLGTMLGALGMEHPEEILFGEWYFRARRSFDGFRDVTIELRQRDAMDLAPAVCGTRLISYRAEELADLEGWIGSQLRAGRAVAVTVDHWEYEASQFHHSGHMPHHLLVCAEVPEGYHVIDPYQYSPLDDIVGLPRFRKWVDSPGLEGARYLAFTVEGQFAGQPRVDEYLRDSWRETIRTNVSAMLAPAHGVAGILAAAARLHDWVDSDGFQADIENRRKLPTTSFLEVGAVRRGHAMWLRRAAAHADVDLAGAANDLTAVANRWDVVSAVRHAYQERLGSQAVADTAFIIRKLRQLPGLIALIADAERSALEKLDSAVA